VRDNTVPQANIVTLRLVDIVCDHAIQPRVGLNDARACQYLRAMREGSEFPPIRVYRLQGDGRLILSDGWHRYEARRLMGADDIEADVRDGTMRDALRHACEANAQQGGLPFTRADQQRAIELYLKDEWLRGLSDREIARRLRCSNATIGAHRARLYPPAAIEPEPDDTRAKTAPSAPASDPSVQLEQQGRSGAVNSRPEGANAARLEQQGSSRLPEPPTDSQPSSIRWNTFAANTLDAISVALIETFPGTDGDARTLKAMLADMLGRVVTDSEPELSSLIRERFTDAKWHTPEVIAAEVEEPIETVITALELMARAADASFTMEKQRFSRGWRYRIISQVETVSLQEVTERVRPLIQRLRAQAKTNMATVAIGEFGLAAHELEQLLREWARGRN
jgi:hypothetical protein